MRYFELVTLCFVDYNVKVFLVNHFTSVKVHGLPTPAVNIYMNISKYEVCVHQLIRGFTPNVFNVYLKQRSSSKLSDYICDRKETVTVHWSSFMQLLQFKSI